MRNEYRAIHANMIEKLYEQYKGQLLKFAYRLSGNEDMAKDILQESFLKIHNLQQSGKVITNYKSLIFRIAYNYFLDLARKNKMMTDIFSEMDRISDQNPGPAEALVQKEKLQLLQAGISKLKKKERGLISLYAESFSYQEMAEILGVRKTSVGKTLSRSMEKIHRSINNEG